jgi:hypothetical protein
LSHATNTGSNDNHTKNILLRLFDIAPAIVDDYGAFNISLINDLPLFIDPFLLFDSDQAKYRAFTMTSLHI